MYRSYSKFYEELLKAIRKRYDEGNPKEIKNDLKLLSEKFQMEFSEADSARKSIENNIMKKWTAERSELSGKGAYNLTANFAKIGGELQTDIFKAVDRGLRNNMSMTEISALLKRTANFGGYRARTVARTAKMGKIRIEYLENHLKAGCRKFEYAGPTGASGSADKPRDFCQKHLGKVYTIEEIQKLDNGQGLSVLIYMGGYNCRHRWRAVYDNDELRIENGKKSVAENSEAVNGVQVHKSWSDNLKRFEERNMTEEIKKYYRERDAAEKMASIGEEMGLNATMKNNVGGQSDVTWKGRSTEIKTPESSKGSSVGRILKKPKQDDLVVIHLKQPFASEKEKATAIRRLRDKKSENPKLRIFLLHDYNGIVKIEEVK